MSAELFSINGKLLNGKSKPLCLICNRIVAVCKEFNLKSHYDTNHKLKFDCYTEKMREIKFYCCFRNREKIWFFTNGDFIKDCMLKVGDVSFPSQKTIIQNISLSRNIVVSRINDLSQNLFFWAKEKFKEYTNFSLAGDESTDTVETDQFAVFIRGYITKEQLKCVPLTGTTANDILFCNWVFDSKI